MYILNKVYIQKIFQHVTASFIIEHLVLFDKITYKKLFFLIYYVFSTLNPNLKYIFFSRL